MKQINLPVTFKPYEIGTEITMIIPNEDGPSISIVVPLSSLPVEALEALAEQFMQDLFKAAGRVL
jgi:hypothetical protein